jgi:hypothetical protein
MRESIGVSEANNLRWLRPFAFITKISLEALIFPSAPMPGWTFV